jgi:CHASE1-domain containing sensor protein
MLAYALQFSPLQALIAEQFKQHPILNALSCLGLSTLLGLIAYTLCR